MRRRFLLLTFLLAACGAEPAPLPMVATGESQTRAYAPYPTTLNVIVPTPNKKCGAEAAIALAQTQSDLALAAVAEVDAVQQTTRDSAAIAQRGQAAFTMARDLMEAYEVPDCLLQGKMSAVQFFGERVAAYAALAIGDNGSYETHLTNGEIARQNMIRAVNDVLGE